MASKLILEFYHITSFHKNCYIQETYETNNKLEQDEKVVHSGAIDDPRPFAHATGSTLEQRYAPSRDSSASSSRGWRSRVDQKSREPSLASPISRKPSNSFNEDGRMAEACRRKNRRHTHTHTHPHAPLLLFLPVPLPLWYPPRCGRGMLAVPSRCSIFRAFRYFPINRKARARAFARSLACSLARPVSRK